MKKIPVVISILVAIFIFVVSSFPSEVISNAVNIKIISTDFLNNLVFWHESLEKEGIGTPEYFLGQFNQWAGFEAYFKDKKWYLKLTTENTDKQILKIKSLINSKDSMAQVKEYIDVRFGDRVIWK